MGRILLRVFIALFLISSFGGVVFSQTENPLQTASDSIREILSRQELFHRQAPQEKAYLHLDKPYYTAGDKIWFKAVLSYAAGLSPDSANGVLYVDLVSQSGSGVQSVMVAMNGGEGFGDLTLPDSITPGRYLIRAYTQWMRNFTDEPLFSKPLSIFGKPADKYSWEISSDRVSGPSVDTLKLSVILTDTLYFPVPNKAFSFAFEVKGMRLMTGDFTTDLRGQSSLSFVIPKDLKTMSGRLKLTVVDAPRNKYQYIQLVPLLPQKMGISFLPEGGYMVAGLPARVAFKAVDEKGNGLHVFGEIVDNDSTFVASFTSFFAGMGDVTFTPNLGKRYAARVTSADGRKSYVALPEVQRRGYVMSVDNLSSDIIRIKIFRSPGTADERLGLVIQTGGKMSQGTIVPMNQDSVLLTVPKSILPTGVSQITLFTSKGAPLSERLVFVNHFDALKMQVSFSKSSYARREKILMNFQVTDALGKPVQTNLSVSVTDANKVLDEDQYGGNILTHMLLTSDIRGEVQYPAYYFNDTTLHRKQALEYLLMTQGWRRYDWSQAFNDRLPDWAFKVEPGIPISGTISNIAAGTPKANHEVLRLVGTERPNSAITVQRNFGWENQLKSPAEREEYSKILGTGLRMAEIDVTKTNMDGRFQFTSYLAGNFVMLLQTRKNNRLIERRIDLDKPSPLPMPSFSGSLEVRPEDKQIMLLMRNREAVQQANTKEFVWSELLKNIGGDISVIHLNEVEVTTSQTKANYSDIAAYTVDVTEATNNLRNTLNYEITDPMEWLANVYYDKVVTTYDNNGNPSYRWIGNRPIFLTVEPWMRADVLTDGMNCIERVDVVDDPEDAVRTGLTSKIANQSGDPSAPMISTMYDPVYVVLYQYADKRCIVQQLGIRKIKWSGYQTPSEFYVPDYRPGAVRRLQPDVRSTLYWNPSVSTSAQGKAAVEFYNTDVCTALQFDVQTLSPQGKAGAIKSSLKMR